VSILEQVFRPHSFTTYLAAYGAILSTATGITGAWLSIAAFLKSRNRVEVTVSKGVIADESSVSATQVLLKAVNKGGEVVTLSNMGFFHVNGKKSLYPTQRPHQLPYELLPGKSMLEYLDLGRLKESLRKHELTEPPVAAFFADEVGRVYKGKMKKKHWKDLVG
jgi:hypothetical protein